MPKAWLTGLSYDWPDSEYADDPHWEERMCGDGHWFPRWYHNHIRYGLLHWGPIGWITVTIHRMREAHGIPRCGGCRRIMWPWIIGYGPGQNGASADCYPCSVAYRRKVYGGEGL